MGGRTTMSDIVTPALNRRLIVDKEACCECLKAKTGRICYISDICFCVIFRGAGQVYESGYCL